MHLTLFAWRWRCLSPAHFPSPSQVVRPLGTPTQTRKSPEIKVSNFLSSIKSSVKVTFRGLFSSSFSEYSEESAKRTTISRKSHRKPSLTKSEHGWLQHSLDKLPASRKNESSSRWQMQYGQAYFSTSTHKLPPKYGGDQSKGGSTGMNFEVFSAANPFTIFFLFLVLKVQLPTNFEAGSYFFSTYKISTNKGTKSM